MMSTAGVSVGSATHDLAVRQVDASTDPRWDAFVLGDPRATAFHRAAWLRVLAEEYDQPHVHLVCEDPMGRIVGVLPLVRTRGVPLGLAGYLGAPRLSSLPRTPLAGPLADGPDATAALLQAAVDLAAERGLHLQIKPVRSALDRVVTEVASVPWRLTYVVDLPTDPADLRFGSAHHHGRIRRMVQKSARDGVRVRTGNRSDLDGWYRVYLEAMRLHAQPARPKRLFAALLAACESDGLGRFSVAEVGQGSGRRIVAGVFSLDGAATASYAFTGLTRAAVTMHPIDALLWDAMHHACAAGRRHYDLGEVPNGHVQLAEFKLKWGARPEQLQRGYWPPMRPDAAIEGGPPAGAASTSVAAWQHLPLGVTALAGRLAHHFL
jgi:CelD/BcsL family acetyltransferase involved in cellulose biosynthesis